MRSLLLLALLMAGCTTPGAPPLAVSATPVPLEAGNPARQTIGRLRFLGGVELRSPNKKVGGLSSLRWRGGRLYATIDEAGWMSFEPVEQAGRLVGVRSVVLGNLRAPNGAPLEGTATGDAEGLTRYGSGWLVSFEHDHKILRYDDLAGPGQPTAIDPEAVLGTLGNNEGIEALASRNERLFLCAERLATAEAANCAIVESGTTTPVALPPPAGLDPGKGWPVDADWAADGTLYILFRSWSGGSDNRNAIVARTPRGEVRTIALFTKPLTVDNFEGLALREEAGRIFLYMISDDNFKAYNDELPPGEGQRTLLLKFELMRGG